MQAIKFERNKYLSDSVKKLLLQNRIFTIVDFLREDIQKLSAITKLTLQQVTELRSNFLSKYAAPLQNGYDLLQRNKCKKKVLKTFIESIDDILTGGIPIGYITEVCGLADSGKTQLCLQIAINCAKNNFNVLYVDTKGDFSAVRIQKILDLTQHTHKDMAQIMYRIRIKHIWSLEELVNFLHRIKEKKEELENLTLMIVDSLPCLLLPFLGDDNKIGIHLLNKFVNISRLLAKEFEIAVVCVNIQTRWVDIDTVDEDDDVSSHEQVYIETKNRCLGKYWHHIPAVLLLLEKFSSETNEVGNHIKIVLARLFDPITKECVLVLDNAGIK